MSFFEVWGWRWRWSDRWTWHRWRLRHPSAVGKLRLDLANLETKVKLLEAGIPRDTVTLGQFLGLQTRVEDQERKIIGRCASLDDEWRELWQGHGSVIHHLRRQVQSLTERVEPVLTAKPERKSKRQRRVVPAKRRKR